MLVPWRVYAFAAKYQYEFPGRKTTAPLNGGGKLPLQASRVPAVPNGEPSAWGSESSFI